MSFKGLLESIEAQEARADKCDRHGDYESTHFVLRDREFWSECPECSREKDEARHAAELAEHRRKAAEDRLQRMLGYACLPPRFASKTFDSYRATNEQQKRYLGRCQAYAANFPEHRVVGEGLMLLGNPGTGKTHLAVATLNQVIQTHAAPGVYTTAARMFRRIKDTYGSREESEIHAIEAFTKPALLVLDEIGVSFGSDAELNYLFDIMNERYEQCLPTIVVSNVQPDELGQWMGDRVVDRLRECSKMMVFNWESARKDIGRLS